MPTVDLGSVMGPQGPQGATGPQGPQGVQGETGPNQINVSTSTTLSGVLVGDNSVVTARPIDTAPTANSANLITSGGVYNGLQRKSNPNLLDNWYFVGGGSQQGGGQFPINQRGQTSYDGNSYSIDRWFARNTEHTGNPIFRLDNDGCFLSTDGLSNQGFNQPIVVDGYKSKTLTLSALVKDVDLTSTANNIYLGLYLSATPGANSTVVARTPIDQDGVFSVTGIVPNNVTLAFLVASIYASSNIMSMKIVAMKLELGDQQTLAHQENGVWVLNDPPPNYQQELAKCQRYQLELCRPEGSFLGIGTATGTTDCKVLCPVPVTLAKIPTLITSGDIILYQAGGTTAVAVSDVYFNALSNSAVGLGITANGLVVGETYKLCSGANASLILDANL